jgi:hypothetical protein
MEINWIHRTTVAARCANCNETLPPGDPRILTEDGRAWCPPEWGCAPPVNDRVPAEPPWKVERA